MTEQEVNNLIDSKIGKTKMSQLPEATQTSGLYSIGYNGNQSVKYKANLLQGDPLTVRKTYQTEALALADKNPIDATTSLPLEVGQFVSIVDDGEKNGIYRIGSISGDGTMSLELQGKLGDLSDYANHGYESNPKTLKEVEDDFVQLAGDVSVKMANIFTNGDFSNGLTGWDASHSGHTYAVASGILTATLVADGDGVALLRAQGGETPPDSVMYTRYRVRALQAGATFISAGHSGIVNNIISSPNANQWYDVIDRYTTGSSTSYRSVVTLIYPTGQALVGYAMEVDYGMQINLTQMFGSGNEPTKEEMDLLISTLGIDYFEGEITIHAQEVMQWHQQTLKQVDDSVSQLADDMGVKVRNLITNGNFVNGTTGWKFGANVTETSVAGSILTFTGGGSLSANNWISRINTSMFPQGHVLYNIVTARSLMGAELYMGIGYSYSTFALTDQWGTYSHLSSNGSTNYPTYGADLGDTVEMTNAMCFDLTGRFGAGNEPTKEEMDSLISNLGVDYFEGGKIINKELPLYILKKINDRDSLYYKLTTNANKDYPIAYDATAPSTGGGRDYILDAKISYNTKYRVNYAYRNRTNTNTEGLDNTVGFYIFDTNGNPIEMVYFRRDENISIGKTGLYKRIYDFPEYEMKLSVTYDLDAMPSGTKKYGNTPESEFYNKAPFMDILYEPYISVTEPSTTGNIVNLQIGKVIGENLYIGSKYDDGNDIIIHFKKCMFNELMTFYRVALAVNSNNTPLINPERGTYENLNVASSDNIGPIMVDGVATVGGNHSLLDDGITKTAETLSFSFHADGKILKDGDTIQAKTFEVRVKNRIYDPRITPPLGATILTDELCIEDVVYRVENGSIFVSLTHMFTTNNPATYYYFGMQSMCSFENEIMTPGGMYTDFTTALTTMSFKKSDYPNFTRFIERNSAKTRYQSAYLIPTFGMGDKSLIGADDYVFLRPSSKAYHQLVKDQIANDGDIRYWAGIYNWFKPYSDDADKLVYTASLGGETYLFIDVKAAIDEHIDIPPHLTYLDYEVVEQSTSITSIGDSISIGIKITASAAGSIVLKYNHNI